MNFSKAITKFNSNNNNNSNVKVESNLFEIDY